MKKIFILRKKEDIKEVLQYGRRIDTPFFLVFLKKNLYPYARFVFVVSKKVDTRASVRNRLKRRVREWIRKEKEFMNFSLDIAFVFKKAAVSLPRQTLYVTLKPIVQILHTY